MFLNLTLSWVSRFLETRAISYSAHTGILSVKGMYGNG
jgi:hypothetical protein